MYNVRNIHIYEDEHGKKMVDVCLECPGTKTGPLLGTWDDHLIHVCVPYAEPEKVVTLVKAEIAKQTKARHEEAIFYSKLKKALTRAN